MKYLSKRKIPPIGHRILKSAIVVVFVYLIYYLRGYQGIPFYSAIAAIQCIQPYKANSKAVSINRVFGTFNGAFYGMITVLIDLYLVSEFNEFHHFLLVSFMIIPLMYTAVIFKYAEVSYFSAVVFLSISINHIGDEVPIIFVLNRVIDTLIGVAVATIVNRVTIPKKRDTKTLFVSGLDEILLKEDDSMTPYSKVELNRMIEKGLRFTIATERTVASLIEGNRGIFLKLPVVVFNGSVLYDLRTKTCLEVKSMEVDVIKRIQELIKKEELCCFTTGFLQETLIIYYDKLYHDAEKSLYESRRTSPYRNYHQGDLIEGTVPFYLMTLGENTKITKLYHALKDSPMYENIRMTRTVSKEYPEQVYLKIYDKEATKQNMIDVLKDRLQVEKTVTVGTIQGEYDIVLKEDNQNKAVKKIKQSFEKPIW
ncbi:MAG: HAD hydrolase family protein [Lachnospiraceae bacterium]